MYRHLLQMLQKAVLQSGYGSLLGAYFSVYFFVIVCDCSSKRKPKSIDETNNRKHSHTICSVFINQ